MELESTNKFFIEQDISKNTTNADVERFLISAIDRFPDYFWTVPASRNKYHPPDERKEGGLVLHTRRVIKLSLDMVRFYELNYWEKDVLVAASVLHDSFARGIPPNVNKASDEMHPFYAVSQFPYNGDADRYLDKKVHEEIMECVVSHQGRFSVHPIIQSKRKLPSIFQMVDHLASRVHIEVKL